MRINIIFFVFFFTLFCSTGCEKKIIPSKKDPTLSKEELKRLSRKTLSSRTNIYSPEKELAGFKVREGFIIELVASERDGIINPIDLSFDDAGNLWTQTAEMYPLDPVADIKWRELLKLMDNPKAQKQNPAFIRIFDLYKGKTKGIDKILVLSNFYDDNSLEVTTWADGLALPQSILPYKNGSFVAQGSEMFFLSDTNNDGKADHRTPLFTGFGITDTHTMAHLLVRAPGDWIHFSHGALNKGEVYSLESKSKIRLDYSKIARFSLDAKKIELVNSGLNNIWGFQLRSNGQWYGTEANDLGYSIVPMESGTGFPGIGSDRIRSYQPWMPQLHEFRVGGTGISGLAFADDISGSFPEEWKDVALLANAITSSINAVKIVRNPDGTVTAEHLEDLLQSEDDWFRPVNMEFGPDGCLYIADWYNKIISHNELPTTHPDRDKKHGRIWRIRHKSQKPREIIDFTKIKTEELAHYLNSPSLWAKRAVWHQISDRPIEETKMLTNELVSIAGDRNQDEITRIIALWSLEGIHHFDENLMNDLLLTKKANLLREAIRSLASFSINKDAIAHYLKSLFNHPNAQVRSQVSRTIEELGFANEAIIDILVSATSSELGGNELGGAYERNFERYLARKALEKYPMELQKYLESQLAKNQDILNLIWASQALPKDQRELHFLSLWKRADFKQLDESNFIIIASMLENKAIYDLVTPVLDSELFAKAHVNWAVKNLSQVQSTELSALLEKPVIHLLQSNNKSDIILGLNASGKLKINNTQKAIVTIIRNDDSPKTLKLALKALEVNPNENAKVFENIANNDSNIFDLRISALHSMVKVKFETVQQKLESWVPKMEDEQKKYLVKGFSGSKQGTTIIKNLYSKNLLNLESFDISSAEHIYDSNKEDAFAEEILNGVKKRIQKDKMAFESKLEKFMSIAERNNGNPKKGEELFQVCLMCHNVGGKGQNLAPALDGSGLRENEALLTAILNPDAALEGSYAVYRVTKKDGSSLEGYLVKTDDKGTTLAFMGGNELFTASEDIKSQGFLGGRSFMINGLLDNYSEAQVSNLLSYIKTLK